MGWGFPNIFFKPKPKPMFLVDCSHHNGKIDWKSVATHNTPKVDGVILKTSTGVGGLDPRVLYNATEARKYGLKVGYYHYCSLNDENELDDAQKEAKWFIQVLKTLPTPDLPVVLDIEDPQILPSLDKLEILNWIKTFFQTLEVNGYKNYVLYSYKPFLETHLPANHGLGNIPLWIAQYRQTLTLPVGWSSYWLWQFSDKGNIFGISGPVDLNKQ